MENQEAALGIASKGFGVFPVHSLQNAQCTCTLGAKCDPRNVAKHPMTKNGVHAATLDVEQIARWWQARPYANIGIGLGSSDLYCLDIDNGRIAKLLLDLFTHHTEGQRFAVAVTGRPEGGCHIYFRAAGGLAKAAENLSTREGEKIGELRGKGTYTIAPPSLHRSGRTYTWVVGSLTASSLRPFSEAHATVVRLLQQVEIVLRLGTQTEISQQMLENAGAVEPVAYPLPSTNSRLRQLLSGWYPTGDRSNTLLEIARLIWQEAQAYHTALTPAQVAGVLKAADQQQYHKFDNRRDGDRWYWDLALRSHTYVYGDSI